MMIKEVTMYTIICDNCKTNAFENEEYSCWDDTSVAEEMAGNADWIEEDGKHYCPDCYSYGENDELVIKEINP